MTIHRTASASRLRAGAASGNHAGRYHLVLRVLVVPVQNAVVFQAYGMASRRILGLTDDRTPPTYSQTFLAGAYWSAACPLHPNCTINVRVASMAHSK